VLPNWVTIPPPLLENKKDDLQAIAPRVNKRQKGATVRDTPTGHLAATTKKQPPAPAGSKSRVEKQGIHSKAAHLN